MKAESLIFGVCGAFFVLVAPAYWFIAYDPTGTAALTMTALLCLLVAFYLGFHASKMDPRPEDLKDSEIADGAGELGFFPPSSWWPLWCAATGAIVVFSIAYMAWWLFIVGAVLGLVSLSGWIFQFYIGDHAH